MALTAEERQQVRYHLGFVSVFPAASINFGMPRPIQTLFLVEQAMDYWNVYYRPGNLFGIVVGDFDDAEAPRAAAMNINGPARVLFFEDEFVAGRGGGDVDVLQRAVRGVGS